MTVYSPYYDPYEDIWYVDVKTPSGTIKMDILNPLYYFHVMNVKPPVGSKFSQDIMDDYENLLEENVLGYYEAPEPYLYLPDQSLNGNPTASSLTFGNNLTGNFNSNPTSNIPNSSPFIPLQMPFVPQISQQAFATVENLITNAIKQNSYSFVPGNKNYSYNNMYSSEMSFGQASSAPTENSAAGNSYSNLANSTTNAKNLQHPPFGSYNYNYCPGNYTLISDIFSNYFQKSNLTNLVNGSSYLTNNHSNLANSTSGNLNSNLTTTSSAYFNNPSNNSLNSLKPVTNNNPQNATSLTVSSQSHFNPVGLSTTTDLNNYPSTSTDNLSTLSSNNPNNYLNQINSTSSSNLNNNDSSAGPSTSNYNDPFDNDYFDYDDDYDVYEEQESSDSEEDVLMTPEELKTYAPTTSSQTYDQ